MKAVRIAVSEDGPLDHFLRTKSIKSEILMEFLNYQVYVMAIAISDSRRSPDCCRRLVPLLFPLF